MFQRYFGSQGMQTRFPFKQIACVIGIVLMGIVTLAMPAIAATPTNLVNGAQVFQAHCEGCHINGGNIIRRGKTLKLSALNRNGMDSPEAIAAIVTNGKNNMSAFRDRLTDQQIQDVTAYVLDRANADWKKS
jgi:cytochrome c6